MSTSSVDGAAYHSELLDSSRASCLSCDFCQEAKPHADASGDEAKPAEAFTASFWDCCSLGVAKPTKAIIVHV